MSDLVDELETQLTMAYNYIVNGEEFDENDESWISAKSLFIDDTDLPNGSSMYGIFLNTYGASVLTYNLNSYFYSNRAVISNTKIHGLSHAMKEYTRMQYPDSGNTYLNPFHAPFEASQMLGDLENIKFNNLEYKGTILTDAELALSKLESNNWNLLQSQVAIDDIMLEWVFETNKKEFDAKFDFGRVIIGCNTDVMIHSGKGINGLRIDGVANVEIINVNVYDISEETPLGNEICGDYDEYDGSHVGFGGGHFRQSMPMQIGFSGNMLQGININAAQNVLIKDIEISNLESLTGPVFGISIWPAVDVTFEGSFKLSTFNAGSNVNYGTFTYDDRPNKAPEVCGVRMYENYTFNGDTYYAVVSDDTEEILVSDMNGHVKCLGHSTIATQFGTEIGKEGKKEGKEGVKHIQIHHGTSNHHDRHHHTNPRQEKGEELSVFLVVALCTVIIIVILLVAQWLYKWVNGNNNYNNNSSHSKYRSGGQFNETTYGSIQVIQMQSQLTNDKLAC